MNELEEELAELRRAVALATDAEARFRSLVEQASNPVFCYECNPPFPIDLDVSEQVRRLYDCVLVECNEACARSYGADSIAEVVGRGLTDLFGTRSGSLDRLFAEMVRNNYVIVDGEGSEILPGGSQRHYLNNAHGVIEDGKLLRIWGTFREITDRKAAEEALRQERELTEAAWDAQRDTFFLFEPGTGRAIRWNRAFREITGYTDEEIAAMPAPTSYYGAEDLGRAADFVDRLPEMQTGTIELDLICKDGRTVPTEYCASVVPDSEGKPRYLISIGRDVTERKRAEEEVGRQRQRLLRFMDSAPDSFHLLDSNLRIIEVSEKAMEALRMAGSAIQSRDGVVGRNLLDIYPFLRGTASERHFRKVLETGEPVMFDDATEHPTRGTVHMTLRAFKVGDDLGVIATDISELKRGEELFRSTFEQAAVGIFHVSVDGRFLRANRKFCDIVGYELEELEQLHVEQLTHADDLEDSSAGKRRLLSGAKGSWAAETRYIRKDGSAVWATVTSSLVRGAEGKPKYFISVVREITARKQMEAERERLLRQLEDSNLELTRFAYTVSHDLKSPLVTIKGFLGLLESDIADGNTKLVSQDMARIGEAADTMRSLLTELLELSRVGRTSRPPEIISLAQLAAEATALVTGPLREGAVTIDISPDLPEIRGDRVRLLQVFQNLIENAIKFIGDQPHPRIEIGMFEQNENRVYYVKDNGSGIDPAFHESVFGLFTQLATHVEGTGVGLALVERIVEVHGGRIWVESEGEGRGSTFCFTLPQ